MSSFITIEIGKAADSQTWFTVLQSCGIIASFLLSAWTIWKTSKSTKLTNYLLLTEFHRDIWSLTLDTTKYDRVRSKDQSLWNVEITTDEKQFMTFVFLHITCSFELSKSNNTIAIEKTRYDITDLMTYPLFRRHWEDTKVFFNEDVAEFINSCTSDISELQPNASVQTS